MLPSLLKRIYTNMRVHRVYIIQVQKVVQNECFDRNENTKKLTQKWLVSNKFYNGIMWQPVWTRSWTKLIRISYKRSLRDMRVHRVYIIQVQKVVQNECFDRNENTKKLTQKWLVSNKFYNGIMWQPVWTRSWTKLIRISYKRSLNVFIPRASRFARLSVIL